MLATTKIYACLADPINHVKAPTIFSSIFKSENIDAIMIPVHVSSQDLKNVVDALKAIKNFSGMTVTIPHKSSIIKFCDHLDNNAEFANAVNWVKFDKDRKLIGNNFDGKGFVDGFLRQNHSFSNKIICIFGAGGAAASIACSVAMQEIKQLKLTNRNIKKAYDLKDKIKKINNKIEIKVISNVDKELDDCDVIINATSLGLHKEDKLPFDVKFTSSDAIIADIIMQPEETKLLQAAKNNGRTIHYGKYMIESQIDLVREFLNI